jgi:hypothetical protein
VSVLNVLRIGTLPADQQLPGCARILLGQGYDLGMLHPQGSDERSIRLYNNVVLLAIASDILSGVKWMDFDLIDRRRDARVGIQ